jgi:hypothetical protein
MRDSYDTKHIIKKFLIFIIHCLIKTALQKKSDALDLHLQALNTNCKMQFHHITSFLIAYVGITTLSGPCHSAGS